MYVTASLPFQLRSRFRMAMSGVAQQENKWLTDIGCGARFIHARPEHSDGFCEVKCSASYFLRNCHLTVSVLAITANMRARAAVDPSRSWLLPSLVGCFHRLVVGVTALHRSHFFS